MSRGDARAALANWLDGHVAGVDVVHTSFPRTLDFAKSTRPGPHACQLVVHMALERERRIATGGAHSGKKRIDYSTQVQVFHHSTARDALDAQDDLDNVVDAVRTRIRADRNLGQVDTVVWQAGEDMEVAFGEPKINGSHGQGAIEHWAAVQFTLTQIITS